MRAIQPSYVFLYQRKDFVQQQKKHLKNEQIDSIILNKSSRVILNRPITLFAKINFLSCVFAWMSPDVKDHPIESLMDHGQLIGICGDGANDCGALKTAHVVEASIATPFTSKEATVEPFEAVILKGSAALASSFHSFRITTVFSKMIITLSILSIMRYSKTSNATVILENFYEDFVSLDVDNEDYDTHVQSFEMITIFLASLISYVISGGLNDFLMKIPTRSPSFFIFIALSIVVMTQLLHRLEYFI
ncbi:MAG: hypothetical protein EZS28_030301 [Streblomastix strix]|uniref:Uncharacterized protein n=1 Tax=Streblomastix strix TaxID=222440 RepID=A0A5J4UUZ6_9EUKA|nr:MAG: hypothetical protein EZS28_030301 [Streblomastix strix]